MWMRRTSLRPIVCIGTSIRQVSSGSSTSVRRRAAHGTRLRTDVEDPLLTCRIEVPIQTIGRSDVRLIHICDRAGLRLVNEEVGNDPCCAYGIAVDVANAELGRYGAALFPNAGSVDIDGLQDLVARIAIADSAARVNDVQRAVHEGEGIVVRRECT